MRFEVFDRDADTPEVPDGPTVKVDAVWLLFNRVAWEFLAAHALRRGTVEVSLGFDTETRTVAVQPLPNPGEVPAGTRCEVQQMRSQVWPKGIDGRRFVQHYRIGVGEYPARFLRGPGARMVTFAVG